jgi:nicotinate-nucleotide adenylyltransferase
MVSAARGKPLAILGGTFDPVHYGHLHLADDVRRALSLPRVVLVPAGDPPHRKAPAASGTDRLAMVELGVEEFPGLAVDPREVEAAGKSYTVRTLRALRSEAPLSPLALIVGGDALAGLPTWHRWREIFELAHLIVVERPGMSIEPFSGELERELSARTTRDPSLLDRTIAGSVYHQPVTPYPISATEVRAALARGEPGIVKIRDMVPAQVLAYIRSHRLYGYP